MLFSFMSSEELVNANERGLNINLKLVALENTLQLSSLIIFGTACISSNG